MCGRKQIAQQKKHKKRANGTGTISRAPGNRSKPWVAQKDHMYIGSYKTYVEAQRVLDECIIATNHAANVSTVAENKKQQVPYSNEEIAAIAKSKLPAAQVMQILLATGCRPNELFKAQTEDCYDNYFISGSKTDAGKNRVIAVSAYGVFAYTEMLTQARAKNCKALIGGYKGNKNYKNAIKIYKCI